MPDQVALQHCHPVVVAAAAVHARVLIGGKGWQQAVRFTAKQDWLIYSDNGAEAGILMWAL